MTALDIITGALQEINAIAIQEAPSSADANFALAKLNRLADRWAARKPFIFDTSIPLYTLTPGLNPHTIGPQGQITQSSRANNVATYECVNNFVNGQSVTVSNSTNGLNGTGNVQSATAAKFSIPSIGAGVALGADTGTVVLTANPVPTLATPNMGQRPQKIEQATLVLNGGGTQEYIDIPINIRDREWWMNVRVKNLQTDIPTDLYYDADWPNGSIYLWPVPNYAYLLRLAIWGTLPKFPSLNYAFSLPQGYEDAVTMQLARDLVGPFMGTWGQQQEDNYKLAIKSVQSNNIKSPRGITGDVGMPGVQNDMSDYNYYSGMPNP